MEIKIFLLQFHKKLEMNKGNDFFTHAFNVVFYEINDKEILHNNDELFVFN